MKHIKFKKHNHIGIIKIQNGSFNTLNSKVLFELDSLIDQIKNDNIKCVIFTGSGDKAFVAGADIKEMSTMNKQDALNHSKLGQKIFSKIESLPIPTIAAINGYALGGGCELALCCHMRYASENTFLGQPEVKLGLIAGFGGTQRLGKVVSKGKALEILLTGKMYSSTEALNIGLIDGVFNDKELLEKVINIAKKIIANGPKSITKTIELVNKSYHLDDNDGFNIESIEFGKLFNEKESNEGMDAFINKRKPNFE